MENALDFILKVCHTDTFPLVDSDGLDVADSRAWRAWRGGGAVDPRGACRRELLLSRPHQAASKLDGEAAITKTKSACSQLHLQTGSDPCAEDTRLWRNRSMNCYPLFLMVKCCCTLFFRSVSLLFCAHYQRATSCISYRPGNRTSSPSFSCASSFTVSGIRSWFGRSSCEWKQIVSSGAESPLSSLIYFYS